MFFLQAEAQSMHAFRMNSGEATSAMLHDRSFEYRHERNSSSSSDSGIAFQLSPPRCLHTLGLFFLILYNFIGPSTSSNISISPPGLSPLQINSAGIDSVLSTPNAASSTLLNHFTFDHVPKFTQYCKGIF